MALFKVIKGIALSVQGRAAETVHSGVASDLPSFFCRRLSSESVHERFFRSAEELVPREPSALLQKRLKVAIVGRPNAGKSTLINKIVDLNVCDVSPKTHTTRRLLRTVFTREDTQIVFVDTPGLVTKKEYSRFNLSDAFVAWKKNILEEIDIIGIIHEVTSPKDVFRLHINLVQSLNEMPETKPMFIILNKIDLVVDKSGLSEAINSVTKPKDVEKKLPKLPNVWNRFSNIFLISALKNIGVAEIVDFLLEQAKPGEWEFQPSVVCDKPLHLLVTDLLRGKVMEILPHEVPYKFRFEVEYMEENDLGEVICVALVKCELEKHFKMLVEIRKNSLRKISQALESDLYKILGKVFKLRVVVCNIGEILGIRTLYQGRKNRSDGGRHLYVIIALFRNFLGNHRSAKYPFPLPTSIEHNAQTPTDAKTIIAYWCLNFIESKIYSNH